MSENARAVGPSYQSGTEPPMPDPIYLAPFDLKSSLSPRDERIFTSSVFGINNKMADPVSVAAGCLAFSVTSLAGTKYLIRWIEGIRNTDEEMEGFRSEIQGLSSVLESVQQSFENIRDNRTKIRGSRALYYFQNIQQVMQDCKHCIERLRGCLPASAAADRSGHTISKRMSFANLKKRFLLDVKSDRILLLRNQLQSYRDVLNIHLSVVILANLSGRQGTSAVSDRSAIDTLNERMRSNQTIINRRLGQAMGSSAGGRSDQTEEAYTRMDNCIRSAGSVISDTSLGNQGTVNSSITDRYFSGESQGRRRGVERWLTQPSPSLPATEPSQRPWQTRPFESEGSHWIAESPRDHGPGQIEAPLEIQAPPSDHFARLEALRGASPAAPMSRISEEPSSIIQSRGTFDQSRDQTERWSNRSGNTSAPSALKKSKSESITSRKDKDTSPLLPSTSNLGRPGSHRRFTVDSTRAGMPNLNISAPLRSPFSFVNGIPDEVAGEELYDVSDTQSINSRRGPLTSQPASPTDVRPSMSRVETSLSADYGNFGSSHPEGVQNTVSGTEARERSAQSDRPGNVTIDTNVSPGESVSSSPSSLTSSSSASSPTTPPSSPSSPSSPSRASMGRSDTTNLSLIIYEQHKRSGSIQLIPSGRAGAKRTEKLLVKMRHQLGNSAPIDTHIELNRLLVLVYKKLGDLESAAKALDRLGVLVNQEDQAQIQIDKEYVNAKLHYGRGKFKEAESLARYVASHELPAMQDASGTSQSSQTSQSFKDSVMLLIDLFGKQNEFAEVQAYTSLLPVGYRDLQVFRDLCEGIDDLLDEGKNRKIDKYLCNGLVSCKIAPSESRLSTIRQQIRNATSVAKGGKGMASQAMPIYSLAHYLAEKNLPSKLEVLYRCVDASPQPPKSLVRDKISLGLDKEWGSPLIIACAHGSSEAAKVLIRKNVDINLRNQRNETALHVSLRNGHEQLAIDLINLGADPTLLDGLNDSAFIVACTIGAKEAARSLIEKNVNINVQNSEGDTALHASLKHKHQQLALDVINTGAEATLLNNQGNSPFLLACGHEMYLAAYALMNKKVNVDVQNSRGETALHISIRQHQQTFTNDLIEAGANISIMDNARQRPSAIALETGQFTLYKKLTSDEAFSSPKQRTSLCELPGSRHSFKKNDIPLDPPFPPPQAPLPAIPSAGKSKASKTNPK
ncbi:MAG: hypothetical protein M1814_004032 [Vezdaea aestivalis]|nr:MAG: hypothetical protein M1814_004032 [Vezdaea aestivalis]